MTHWIKHPDKNILHKNARAQDLSAKLDAMQVKQTGSEQVRADRLWAGTSSEQVRADRLWAGTSSEQTSRQALSGYEPCVGTSRQALSRLDALRL